MNAFTLNQPFSLVSIIGKLFLCLFFIALRVNCFSNGPGGEIKGVVICTASSHELEYAAVSLFSLPDSANVANEITGASGLFRFRNIPEGQYFLVIHFMGYEKKIVENISVGQANRQADLGKIGLQVSLYDLDEVEIKDIRNPVTFEIDKTVVDVGKELAAQGGTAVDALQNVPSVQVDALGQVLLRGSADFTLLINGKPTLMDPVQLLQQTPAETIESIEIITNPSVKYEAKGTAGIINLKLKKQYKSKTEGLVNLSIANGDKYSGSVMANRQFGKFSAFASVSFSDKTQRTSNRGFRDVSDADSAYQETIHSNRRINRFSADMKVGAGYEINEKTSLGFSAQIGTWKFTRDIASDYRLVRQGLADSLTSQVTHEEFLLENKFISGDITFNHLFKNKEGHKIDLAAFYGGLLNSHSDNFDVEEPLYSRQFRNTSDRSQFRFSADYSLPLKQGITFSAGLLTEMQLSGYDYSISDSMAFVDFTIPVAGPETQFDYENSVNAAYSSIKGTINKWFDYEAGLRLEIYHYNLDFRQNEFNASTTASNLFPSLHLSRELKEKHRFGLSYSRRVSRPDEWQLSPVLYSSDSYETKMGNPHLLSSYIDSYELSHMLMINKIQLNTVLYYRNSHDPIGSYFLDIDGRFVETYANLDKEISSGVELAWSYKPLEWLRFRVTGNAYHSQWIGRLADGNEPEGSSIAWNGSFTSTVNVKKNTTFQFLAIYYAPGEIPQGHADEFYYFDFILNHSFFNKKLVLGLRTHNTFDTGLYHYSVSGDGYYAENWYRYEGPVFIFTLSYKLNNFKQKQPGQEVRIDFDSGLDH